MSADIIHLRSDWTPAWTFAEKLRKVRRETQMNQADFAKTIGVGKDAYAAWESGRNQPRNVADLAVTVAEKTGVSVTWLLDGTGHKPTGPKRPRQESNLRPRDYKANVRELHPFALQVAS